MNRRANIKTHFLIPVILSTFSNNILAEQTPIPRIINGNPASTAEFPWMANLFIENTSGDGSGSSCGGSLIDEEWILTAAHCFLDDAGENVDLSSASRTLVLLGSDTVEPPDNGSTSIQASQVFIHPNYDPNSQTSSNVNDFDIALLKLSSSVNISPITLLSGDVSSPAAGSNLTVLGWGATGVDSNNQAIDASNDLLQTDQIVVSNASCSNIYSGSSPITDNMICANGNSETDNSDSCQGDSGGPIFITDNNNVIQVGLSSFGGVDITCGDPQVPGVYTRVSQFIDFITEQVPNLQISSLGGTTNPTPTACPGASVDANLNINLPCVLVNGNAFETVLNKLPEDGFFWQWPGTLSNSSCTPSPSVCTTIDTNLGLTIRGVLIDNVPNTATLRFDGDESQNEFFWEFDNLFAE